MESKVKHNSATPRPQQVELRLGDYNVNGASIDCDRDGITYAFTIGPVLDSTVAALEGVAQKHGRLCLYCYDLPLLIDLVALERKEPRKARIVGRIVGSASDAGLWGVG